MAFFEEEEFELGHRVLGVCLWEKHSTETHQRYQAFYI